MSCLVNPSYRYIYLSYKFRVILLQAMHTKKKKIVLAEFPPNVAPLFLEPVELDTHICHLSKAQYAHIGGEEACLQ